MAPLLGTIAILFCSIGILLLATRQPANHISLFATNVWEKGGEYFPVQVSPFNQVSISYSHGSAKGTEANDDIQAFISMQNNMATSWSEDLPPCGYGMIEGKIRLTIHQPFKSSSYGNITPGEETLSSMSLAGISSRDVICGMGSAGTSTVATAPEGDVRRDTIQPQEEPPGGTSAPEGRGSASAEPYITAPTRPPLLAV